MAWKQNEYKGLVVTFKCLARGLQVTSYQVAAAAVVVVVVVVVWTM